MKKIFTLVAAVLATISLSATQTVVATGNNQIEAAITAASAGDTLVLQTGEYFESDTRTIDKQLTLMAAQDAKPVVQIAKFLVHAPFEVNGIELYSYNSDYMFQSQADVVGTFALKNCTLRDSKHRFVYIESGKTVDKLYIENCIFKNCYAENAIVYVDGAATEFEMKNSTVFNAGTYAVRVKSASTITIDHCTLCNVGKQAIRLVETPRSGNINVSNCVVYGSTKSSDAAYYLYAGTVSNSVYYNTGGVRSGDAKSDKVVNADPLFVDTANFNLNFAFTSPLFLGGTDGKNIGDPRWTVEAGEAVAIPATLPNDKAALAGPKIALTEDGIAWNDQSDPTLNSASWTVEVNNAAQLDVVLNVSSKSTSGHQCAVALYCADSLIASVSEAAQCATTGEIKLGTFDFPAAGKYMVRLTNATQWSSAIVESLSFTDHATGVSVLKAKQTSKKIMVNGQMVIVRDGEQYNVLGTKF